VFSPRLDEGKSEIPPPLLNVVQPAKVVKNIFLTRHGKYKINLDRKNGS
jgi:hypothetical protein